MSRLHQNRFDLYTALAQDMSCYMRMPVAPFVDVDLARKHKAR